MRIPWLILTVFSLIFPFFSHEALAYFSTMDTGEVLDSGHYRVLAEPQFISNPSGFNFTGGMDAPLTESMNIRALLGVGSVNFHSALLLKWIPFPDFDQQPAIGLITGIGWARYDSESYLSFRGGPIISKKFETDIGLITPYVATPFAVVSGPGDNTFPFFLEAGGEWRPEGLENLRFLTEIGLNLNEAFNYVSFGVLLYFDEEKGIEFK